MPEDVTPQQTDTNTPTGAVNTGAVTVDQQAPAEQVFTLTQTALSERLRRQDEAALKRLLGDLGVDDLDTAKAKIAAATQAEQASQTELERAAGRITELEQQLAQATQALEAAQAQRVNDALDAAIREAAKDAVDPQDVVLWAHSTEGEGLLEGAVNDKGEIDRAKVEAAVKACREKKAHYFAPAPKGHGSPSNARGRTPEPNSDLKAKMRKELQNQVRF